MQIVPFPSHYQSVCTNYDFSSFSRISYSYVSGILSSSMIRMLPGFVRLSGIGRLSAYHVKQLQLPLKGTKAEKDISDYFALGNEEADFRGLLNTLLSQMYAQTMMLLRSCEIDYDNPPDASKSLVAVNGVPLGTQDNLFCITGGEGTGKSNYVSAILAGALAQQRLDAELTLGLEVTPNPRGLAVLHYDTEQSEAQLHKSLGKTLCRASLTAVSDFYHSLYLASLSRKDRTSWLLMVLPTLFAQLMMRRRALLSSMSSTAWPVSITPALSASFTLYLVG